MTVAEKHRGALIAAHARSLIGTPYVHQGRVPGVGMDCLGVPVECAREFGLEHTDFADYSGDVDGVRIVPELKKIATLIEGPHKPGDILVFWVKDENEAPQHFGIATGPRTFVHAHARESGPSRVEESRLSRFWRERLHSVWRYGWRP